MKLPQDLKCLLLAHPEKKLEELAVFADTLWISTVLSSSPSVLSMPADDLGAASASPPSLEQVFALTKKKDQGQGQGSIYGPRSFELTN